MQDKKYTPMSPGMQKNFEFGKDDPRGLFYCQSYAGLPDLERTFERGSDYIEFYEGRYTNSDSAVIRCGYVSSDGIVSDYSYTIVLSVNQLKELRNLLDEKIKKIER